MDMYDFHRAFQALNARGWHLALHGHWTDNGDGALFNIADYDSSFIPPGKALAVMANIETDKADVFMYQRPAKKNDLRLRKPPKPLHTPVVVNLKGKKATAIANALEKELNYLIEVEQTSGIGSLG